MGDRMNCSEFFQSLCIFFIIFLVIVFTLVTLERMIPTDTDNTGLGIFCISPILSIPFTVFVVRKVYVAPKRQSQKRKRKLHD